ncbi:MAG: hypothetical protein DRI24_14555 [Deltaproteobacteria bacterium]|nr:MAG: hypothetical protein DRI24_14555 [Deltaproteobacteria bacterium]
MVMGRAEEPNTVFYEQSKMDTDLSKAAGKRVYSTVLMVKYTQPGVTDWAPARAQKEDIAKHPDEYQIFLDTRADVGSPSIDIIPGITPDEQQELIDYGMLTVTKLCEANTVPAHLEHVQASARRINGILKQEQQANEQVHEHESSREADTETAGPAQTVSAPDRPIDAGHVEGPSIPASEGDGQGQATKRLYSGGRLDSSQGLTPNWNISF